MKRLLVVGGGISGLAAAWRARCSGAAVEVTLIEQDQRLGGKILTEERDGFILDAAADGFLSRKQAGIRLCEELGISGLLVNQVPRRKRSFVMRSHALYPLPEGFSGLVPTDMRALQESPLLTEEGKRRALQERDIPPDPAAADDESVAQFMTRRFGAEVFQALMEPLLSGIYAGRAECLSLRATFPRLRELELRCGSVLEGLAREAARDTSGPRSTFVSFPRGMGDLVRALAESLSDVRVLTATQAAGLRRYAAEYRVTTEGGETLSADALILALPAASAAKVLSTLDPDLAEAHAGISAASTAVIHLAYRQEQIGAELDGYGYVIPRMEGSDILACTWSSSKWPGRAPPGTALLRLYAGRYGGPDTLEQSDAELVRAARVELAETLGVRAQPVLSRVFRWPAALPQYALDHPQRLEAIESAARRHPGLFLAGASYRGVGIPDCIESGFQAAEAALSGQLKE